MAPPLSRRARSRKVDTALVVLTAVVGLLVSGLVGTASPASAVTVGAPSKVRAFQSISGTSMTLTVYWASARKATKYQVSVSSSTSMKSARVITTSARKAVISRLSASRSYCLQVRGLNGRSRGPAAKTVCTPTRPNPPWVASQDLQSSLSGDRTAITLRWPRSSRAAGYEIDYAPSPSGALIDIQASRARRTLTVRATSASTQSATVAGLTPGVVHCFQVRATGSAGASGRGARHCKMAMRASRVEPAAAVPLSIGTFNTCSAACADELGTWSQRAPAALDRVLSMHAGVDGRPIDVLAVQEGHQSTERFEDDLDGTFTKACASGGRLQSVFVRDDTWQVVAGTADSVVFSAWDDATHGACWVRIRDVITGLEVVVVGLHLYHPSDAAADAVRAQEIDWLADRVEADFPDVPIVYAGDTNSHRTRQTDAPRLRLEQSGLDDAYDQAALYASLPSRNSACGKVCLADRSILTSVVWGDHVDRVFAPADVRVASWKLDVRLDGNRYAAPLLSDHNPVVVELRFPAPEPQEP